MVGHKPSSFIRGMKKWKAFRIVIIATGLFLFVQLLIWTKFASKNLGEPTQSKTKQVVHALQSAWQWNQPLFILEPHILKSIASYSYFKGQDVEDHCQSLCQSKNKFITMGLIGDVNKNMRTGFHDLRSKRFSVVDAVDEFPEKNVSVVTHVFLQHMHFPEPSIHVVVFYPRTGDFYWHSEIQISADHVMFGNHAGSFPKFKLDKVKIDGLSVYVPDPLQNFIDQIPTSKFIECDKNRAVNFVQVYKPDTSDSALQFKRKARQLVAKGKHVLDKLNIPFWLSSGTCLGWFRQCDIITHAKDVDFGIFAKHYKPEVIEAFKEAGLPIKHVFGNVNDSFELSFHAGDLKLDIFFFYEDKDFTWNGGTEIKDGAKYKYNFVPFKLCWSTLLDLHIRVPCPTEQYVKDNYGEGWGIPQIAWDWKRSPPNVRENGFWSKDKWDEVMQIFD